MVNTTSDGSFLVRFLFMRDVAIFLVATGDDGFEFRVACEKPFESLDEEEFTTTDFLDAVVLSGLLLFLHTEVRFFVLGFNGTLISEEEEGFIIKEPLLGLQSFVRFEAEAYLPTLLGFAIVVGANDDDFEGGDDDLFRFIFFRFQVHGTE